MMRWKKGLAAVAVAIGLGVLLTACPNDTGGNKSAEQTAKDKAASHQVYSPTHDIEFKNYNQRQKIADDPTTILWCTSAFPIPSSPLFTVPVLGKLTSGSKRPYPTSTAAGGNNGAGYYSPEIPGPDGMYGASDPYRYGFTPEGAYVEWANMSTYCSNQPTVWQRDNTSVSLAIDPTLALAQKQAQALLAAGTVNAAGVNSNADEAQAILVAAIAKVAP